MSLEEDILGIYGELVAFVRGEINDNATRVLKLQQGVFFFVFFAFCSFDFRAD